MRAVLECWSLVADEAQPSFVDERRRLECLTSGFIRHFARGEPAQFLIYQRQELIGSFRVAALDRVE